MDLTAKIFQDALFAAIAAIGFAAISRPPLRAYPYCALIAALGHSMRFILMNNPAHPVHIFGASLAAAFFIGVLAVFLSPIARPPAEACFFPSLLPMIPGMYAYKAFGGLAMCVLSDDPQVFDFYFFQFSHNAFVCISVLLGMVIGATAPVFIFKKISFQATR